jgi:hypothetical protein
MSPLGGGIWAHDFVFLRRRRYLYTTPPRPVFNLTPGGKIWSLVCPLGWRPLSCPFILLKSILSEFTRNGEPRREYSPLGIKVLNWGPISPLGAKLSPTSEINLKNLTLCVAKGPYMHWTFFNIDPTGSRLCCTTSESDVRQKRGLILPVYINCGVWHFKMSRDIVSTNICRIV